MSENLAPLARDVEPLTPAEIVRELDRYIVGQNQAKRAVANALRNRWRRRRVPADLFHEISPKNIIMIGPTGVGKTEIARRLAKLTRSPFIKVEATKFTEVGYIGRDVESIIRDLVEIAIQQLKEEHGRRHRDAAEEQAENRLLDALLLSGKDGGVGEKTRESFRRRLRAGELEDHEVEVEVAPGPVKGGMEIFSNQGMEEINMQLSDMFSKMMKRDKKKTMRKVSEARKLLLDEAVDKLVDMEKVRSEALERVQQSGIVFLDEIDKVAKKGSSQGPDVSREGVQRDILPIVEGSTVNTKHGMVKTDHILFIAAGAFHMSKPSDLIPELQGRFPIRVELDALGAEEFVRILTEPKNSLVRQYTALLETEEVTLEFREDGLKRLAEIAQEVNERAENIGARRLHTILEFLLDEVSFHAPNMKGQTIVVDTAMVESRLQSVVTDQDLSRYIL